MKHYSTTAQAGADVGSANFSIPEVADGLWRIYAVLRLVVSNGSLSESSDASAVVTSEQLSGSAFSISLNGVPFGDVREKTEYDGSALFELTGPFAGVLSVSSADPIAGVAADITVNIFAEKLG